MVEALVIILCLGSLEWYLDKRRAKHDEEWKTQEASALKEQTELLEDILVTLNDREDGVPSGVQYHFMPRKTELEDNR